MKSTKDIKEQYIEKSMLEYAARGLDFCQFCGKKYNVGERIPRILVHCGHTFCTDCLNKIHKRNRIRCPLCTKLIKNIETAEKLPLNMNILYEYNNNFFKEELLEPFKYIETQIRRILPTTKFFEGL